MQSQPIHWFCLRQCDVPISFEHRMLHVCAQQSPSLSVRKKQTEHTKKKNRTQFEHLHHALNMQQKRIFGIFLDEARNRDGLKKTTSILAECV